MSRTIQEKKTTGGCFGATPIEQRACSLRWKPLSSHMAAVIHCFHGYSKKFYKPTILPISAFRIDPSPK